MESQLQKISGLITPFSRLSIMNTDIICVNTVAYSDEFKKLLSIWHKNIAYTKNEKKNNRKTRLKPLKSHRRSSCNTITGNDCRIARFNSRRERSMKDVQEKITSTRAGVDFDGSSHRHDRSTERPRLASPWLVKMSCSISPGLRVGTVVTGTGLNNGRAGF